MALPQYLCKYVDGFLSTVATRSAYLPMWTVQQRMGGVYWTF